MMIKYFFLLLLFFDSVSVPSILQGRELFLISFAGEERRSYALSLREVLVKDLSLPSDFIEIREVVPDGCRRGSFLTPVLHLCVTHEKKMEVVSVDYALLRRFEIFQKDLSKIGENRR